MDVDEFTQQVSPRQKRSRLLKYKTEIANLKSRGYTDQQIRDWLAKNDLDVSREAVRKFIKNHLTAASTTGGSAAVPAALPAAITAQPGEPPPAAKTQPESQAEKMRRRVREQQHEARNTQFKHDKTGNNIKE